ncbi:hypothetical protein FSP39_020405 [Pinctada imbricata]|uniref:HAT C-terminal dimerisation domain-containing protein n=1 Tax=Pinctada imbricata TaxID=66713 RepID=A0AA89CBB8_PINIB|nr:hypothetical protein FSP39_020405 [Pinctada imbricata]
MDLIMTLSPSSAEAERGFSQLKLIKTRIRSNLGQKTLNDCLVIKLHSDEIKEYNPQAAIKNWNLKGFRARRPTFEKRRYNSTNSKNCDGQGSVFGENEGQVERLRGEDNRQNEIRDSEDEEQMESREDGGQDESNRKEDERQGDRDEGQGDGDEGV